MHNDVWLIVITVWVYMQLLGVHFLEGLLPAQITSTCAQSKQDKCFLLLVLHWPGSYCGNGSTSRTVLPKSYPRVVAFQRSVARSRLASYVPWLCFPKLLTSELGSLNMRLQLEIFLLGSIRDMSSRHVGFQGDGKRAGDFLG